MLTTTSKFDTQFFATLLVQDIYTSRQLAARKEVLKSYLEYKLFQDQNSTTTVANFFSSYLTTNKTDISYQDWLINLDKSFIDSFTPSTYTRSFQELDLFLEKHLREFVVYLPFDIKESGRASLEKLGGWFKTNIDIFCLIEVRFDATLVGGCALSVKGVYQDFSLKAQISENRNQILEALKGFRK